MSIRHDWYQSEVKVVVSIMIKNAAEKNCQVQIERERLSVSADGYELNLNLFKPIDVTRSSYKLFSTKVEVSLAKEVGEKWDNLEMKETPIEKTLPQIHKKNWDSLAKEVEKKEEEEAESDEALQKLFINIYKNSTPEVRKAMNKSFLESSGTVLSTNWDEVGKDKVDVKPPDGTEYHAWNGN